MVSISSPNSGSNCCSAEGMLRMRRWIRRNAHIFCLISICTLIVVYQLNYERGSGYFAVCKEGSKIPEHSKIDPLRLKRSLTKEYYKRYTLHGRVFKTGEKFIDVTTNITTSVVHKFSSEEVESFFDTELVDKFFVMSPGMSSANGHSIDLVYRVWVKTKHILAQMQSVLNKNYLVHQRLHTNYTPKTKPRILGIPAPIIQTYGGPQDPRVYHYAGSPWVIFNKFLPTNRTCEHKITNVALYTYNLDTHQIRRIRAMNGEFRCREKNWSPLIKDDKLFFIYSLEPTVLLDCKTNGECMFRKTSNSISKVNADHQVLPLIRGSTQFVPYKWPYYVAIVHAKWTKTSVSPKSPLKYTNHMLLFNAESYEITFMSKDIQLRDDFLRSSVPVYRHIYYPFLYPVSLLVRDPDTLHVGLHHNDRDSVVMEISGVEEVLNTVIRLADERGRPAPRATRKYIAGMNPFM